MFVVYPLALKIWNVPALRFFKHVAPAMLVAATTTSSTATLPMEMNIAEEKLGLDENVYGFSLPLGNTMNMNGMAAAFGVIAVFAFDIFGVEITPLRLVQTALLGLMLAVGAAGVKGAGIVMSAVFFESLGLPLGLVPHPGGDLARDRHSPYDRQRHRRHGRHDGGLRQIRQGGLERFQRRRVENVRPRPQIFGSSL